MKKIVMVGIFAAMSLAAPAFALPCLNIYRSCKSNGGSSQTCEAVWQSCMSELYDTEL